MRIAVITCWKYKDAWEPFSRLFDKFWPNPGATLEFVTDTPNGNEPWCEVLLNYVKNIEEPVCLFQEDFFLTAPVQTDLVQRGLEQLEEHKAGCVRLYPCPGGDIDYGDPHFAIVPRGTKYRISCQASLWSPRYLRQILQACGKTPADFEISGTTLADMLDEPVLAFKRDVRPWALEYITTAIVRGLWDPNAKKLCEEHGISVDWSQRGFMEERIKA